MLLCSIWPQHQFPKQGITPIGLWIGLGPVDIGNVTVAQVAQRIGLARCARQQPLHAFAGTTCH